MYSYIYILITDNKCKIVLKSDDHFCTLHISVLRLTDIQFIIGNPSYLGDNHASLKTMI